MIMSSNQTVYVRNLNEKVKIDELKKTLYHAFSAHGNVIEVMACKRNTLRGQAWIVFEDPAGAIRAVREMNGFTFFDKPMEVTFAREKSDVVAKADGTHKPRPKRKRASGGDGDDDDSSSSSDSKGQENKSNGHETKSGSSSTSSSSSSSSSARADEDDEAKPTVKQGRTADNTSSSSTVHPEDAMASSSSSSTASSASV